VATLLEPTRVPWHQGELQNSVIDINNSPAVHHPNPNVCTTQTQFSWPIRVEQPTNKLLGL
jgi:hypothetical protein